MRITNPQLRQHCLQSRGGVSNSAGKTFTTPPTSKPTSNPVSATSDMPKNPLFIELGEKIRGTGSDGNSLEIPDDAIIIPMCEKGNCPQPGPKSQVHFAYIDEKCNTKGNNENYDVLYKHLRFLTSDPTAKKDIISVMRKVTERKGLSQCFKYGKAQVQNSDILKEIQPKVKTPAVNEAPCPPPLQGVKAPVKKTADNVKPIFSRVASYDSSLPMRVCKHHDQLGSELKIQFEIIPDIDGINRCYASIQNCGNTSVNLSKRISQFAKAVDSALPFHDCRAVMDGVVSGICGPWSIYSQKQKVENVIGLFEKEFKSHPDAPFSKMKEPDRTNFYLCVFARETANTFEPTIINGTMCGATELKPDSSFGLAQMVPATFEWMCNANQIPTECGPKSKNESESEWKKKIKEKWASMATDVPLQIKASFALLNFKMNSSDPVSSGLGPWNQSPGYSSRIKTCMTKCAQNGPTPKGPDSDILHSKYYCLQSAMGN